MTHSLIQYNGLQKKKKKHWEKNKHTQTTIYRTFLAFNIPQQSYNNLVYPNSLKLEHFQKVFVAEKG